MPKANKRKQNVGFSWWQKQNVAIKGVLIAGAFALLAALCGVVGSSIPPAVTILSQQAAPKISATGGIWAINSLFAIHAVDPSTPGQFFEIVTPTCLEIFVEPDYWFRTNEHIPKNSSPEKLEGAFRLLVFTDKPIIMKQAELQVLRFVPLDLKVEHPLTHNPAGGGGAWVKEVPLESVRIFPRPQKYSIFGGRSFQLPSEQSVTFTVPFHFDEPGSYTISFNISTSSFGGVAIPVLTTPFEIKWMYIDKIDPASIHLLGGSDPGSYPMKFRLCP